MLSLNNSLSWGDENRSVYLNTYWKVRESQVVSGWIQETGSKLEEGFKQNVPTIS